MGPRSERGSVLSRRDVEPKIFHNILYTIAYMFIFYLTI